MVAIRCVALALVLASCGSRREVVQSPPPSSGAVTVQAAPSAQPAGGECRLTLEVGRVQTRAGCTIDERVSGQSAVLTYPCGGGRAVASFGATVFEGSVTGGQVDVSTETAFPFSDGCQWRSKQRISGGLGGGALDYTYEERPDPGQGGCANGCTGTATVQAR